MANVRDQMTAKDAMEMEERYEAVIREHNDRRDAEIRNSWPATALFDWEVDLPDWF